MLANFVLWREAPTTGLPRAAARLRSPRRSRKRLSMYVLRSKVTLTDVVRRTACASASAARRRRTSCARPSAQVPAPFGRRPQRAIATCWACRGRVYRGRRRPPRQRRPRAPGARMPTQRRIAVWQWLTIRAGVPVVTAATQDPFVAQAANWDVLGGVNFRRAATRGRKSSRGCSISGRLKERLFLVPRGRRRRLRAGDAALQRRRSASSPAAPSSMRRRRRAAAATCSPSCRSPPSERGDLTLGATGRMRSRRCRCPTRSRRRERRAAAPGRRAPTIAHVPRAASRSTRIPRLPSSSPPIATSITRAPPRPRPGGARAGSPDATSRPAARGSASPVAAAGHSSPTSASPIAATRRTLARRAGHARPRRRGAAGGTRRDDRRDAARYNGFNLSPAMRVERAGDRIATATSRRACSRHPRPFQRRARYAMAEGRANEGRARAPGARAASDDPGALFAVLGDRRDAPDHELPATGVSLEWERLLSSPFIVGEDYGYGTRCSTVRRRSAATARRASSSARSIRRASGAAKSDHALRARAGALNRVDRRDRSR